MIKIYVSLIEKGEKTIEDVPAKIKKEVQAILSQQNER